MAEIEYLDAHFPDLASLCKIDQALQQLETENQGLTQQREQISSEIPNLIKTVLAANEKAKQELDQIQQETKNMTQDLTTRKKKFIEHSSELQKKETAELFSQLQANTQKLLKECKTAFTALTEGSGDADIYSALFAYTQLVRIERDLHPVPCTDLKTELNKNIRIFTTQAQELKVSLITKSEAKLKALEWPEKKILTNHDFEDSENLKSLILLFKSLSLIQVSVENNPISEEKSNDYVVPIVITLLLKKITESYNFHFRGTAPTNNILKPEWPYTFIFKKLDDHALLLEKVDEIIKQTKLHSHGAKIEFIRGLLDVHREKLTADLPQLREPGNLKIFWNTINETLSSVERLHRHYKYPLDLPNPVSLFTEQFEDWQFWLQHEVTNTIEYLRSIVGQPDAWVMRSKGSSKPCQCVFNFIKLLQAIQERAQLVPNFKNRLFFIEQVQVPLLSSDEDYIILMEELLPCSTVIQRLEKACLCINTLDFLNTILLDWEKQPFYIELGPQYFLKTRTSYLAKKDFLFKDLVSRIANDFVSEL